MTDPLRLFGPLRMSSVSFRCSHRATLPPQQRTIRAFLSTVRPCLGAPGNLIVIEETCGCLHFWRLGSKAPRYLIENYEVTTEQLVAEAERSAAAQAAAEVATVRRLN